MGTTPSIVSRLAPSPTGQLHLGNAWAFLLCWLTARQCGGQIVLRIDDIDTYRSRKTFAENIIADLQWLGLTYDGEILWQSNRASIYNRALTQIGHCTYPCFCSRKELRTVATAPHLGEFPDMYNGKCAQISTEERTRLLALGKQYSVRLRTPRTSVDFVDLIQGKQSFTPEEFGGDFVLKRGDGVFAYHLATVVDDAAQGVNLVVRGRDLLSSTPRQILLHRVLNLPLPQYAHIPLLLDEAGERLAKRHHSLSLAALHNVGVKPQAIIGFLGQLALGQHIGNKTCLASPDELLPHFKLDLLPKQDLVITSAMVKSLG